MNSDTEMEMEMEMEMDKDKDKKKRPSDTIPSSPTSKRNKSLEADLNSSAQEEFKGSKEAFHLTVESVNEVFDAICSGDAPKMDKWDVYVKSFYEKTLKLYNSYPKEQTISEESESEQESSEKDEDMAAICSSTAELSSDDDEDDFYVRPYINGPFDFGFYTEGNKPKCVPYHLYLLVKEAVDIMSVPAWPNINPEDLKNLNLVERKIMFFCNYFHCHLPTNWKYSRKSVIDFFKNCPVPPCGYDMASYTPISTFEDFKTDEWDEDSSLSRKHMIKAMGIIHSRKTPAYWKMMPPLVLFYCKICSCFGLDYDRLETASDDKVSLMKVV